MKQKFAFVFFFVLFVVAVAFSRQKPKLIVLVSIDQMIPEYFERYDKQLSGGLKRFSAEGIVFTNTTLNYASSETGPGHATISTGSYPATSGILANEWYDPKTLKRVNCAEDSTAKPVDGEGGGFSPKNLVVTALGDWLKAESPVSKVVSVSAKDRAAILMGGKRPNHAFWYDRKSGRMVTSSYYAKAIPEWARKFNEANWVEKNLPGSWWKLKPAGDYEMDGPDELKGEMIWGMSSSFPHQFAIERRNDQILTSPWGDMLVLDFARAAIDAEKLGQRALTDILFIGLSCTDYVGHSFGPNSHEIHDHLLRLDQALGTFISDVEKIAGSGNVLFVLSSDHGVMPLPEHVTNVAKGYARRLLVDSVTVPKVTGLERQLQKELNTSEWLISRNGFLNYEVARKGKFSHRRFEEKVREGLLSIDGIADVFFKRELTGKKTRPRQYLGHFQRSYYAPRGEDFQLLFCENCLPTTRPTGTSHGSAYKYDNHIPLIFMGWGLKPARVTRETHSVDIAPTLARILDVPYPKTVDGSPLSEVRR
ncbi:MAG: alkaline phosphatase family protein [Ignavibacteriales bacterium]|nr:alkaline phosphatase family protein [Ignavibacteriales bacterium]